MRTAARSELEEQFADLYGAAYRSALRITHNRAEAEDAAGEASYRLARHWNQVMSYAQPWIIVVAARLALDGRRRNEREARSLDEPSNADPYEAVVAAMDMQALLSRLPNRQRQVIALRYFADLTEAGTADQLNMAPGTAKSHMSRATGRLRHELAEGTSNPTSAKRIQHGH